VAAIVASLVAVMPPEAPVDGFPPAPAELLDPQAASSNGRTVAATPTAKSRP
jgi:hypothetical protein